MIDFASFLDALGLPEPYDWQREFAERCADGDPPDVVAVPTGSGKTTAVEALVWALAKQADRPVSKRTVGVRIVWAIDRRILVDEVHERALRLARRLALALDDSSDVLHKVAGSLARLGGGAIPLVASRWRGGIAERAELVGPLQPQVITSTVAQIGSRLLFRGYGVGPRSLALEAGLAACDTTICLDEAHLVEPFRQTVHALVQLRSEAPEAPTLPPLRLITLTATPSGREGLKAIELSDRDREQLGPRYYGKKLAYLADAGERANEQARADLLVARTLEHLDNGADSVACVVNTVRRARAVLARLQRARLEDIDVCLLVGPQRPHDRERLIRDFGGKLFERSSDGRRLVCVATQTFEVGLDADVEAMVTESASMQALVQRLGRLNRRGDRAGRATIVRDPEPWLYGEDERHAWEWLQQARRGDAIDVSVAALDRAKQTDAWPTPADHDCAPSLTSEIADALAMTWPRPGTWQEPDVEAFLNGVNARPTADVTVCWRADLRPELMDKDADEFRRALMTTAPPRLHEQLTLSVSAARALIVARCLHDRGRNQAARVAQEDVDIDVAPPPMAVPDVTGDGERVPFLVLRDDEVLHGVLRDDGRERTVRPRDIAPGDIVVLPSSAGGCDAFGLAPASPGRARDVGADVVTRGDDEVVPVRLTPEALREALDDKWGPGVWEGVRKACRRASQEIERARSTAQRRGIAAGLVRSLASSRLVDHPGLQRLLTSLDDGHVTVALESIGERAELEDIDDEDIEQDDTSPADGHERDGQGEEAAHDDDEGSEQSDPTDPQRPIETAWVLVPKQVRLRKQQAAGGENGLPTLAEHAAAVHDRLSTELQRLQLPARVTNALGLAARVHDHGKADPRFQAFLRRGVRPIGAPLVAKSDFEGDRATADKAAVLSGLPRRFGHEGASVAVLEHALDHGRMNDLADEIDLDLAFVAVGTHHGRARPLPSLPVVEPRALPPALFYVDEAGIAGAASGDGIEAFCGGRWLKRLGAANRRYGHWGVAYLVGLLMLADRMVSAEGS